MKAKQSYRSLSELPLSLSAEDISYVLGISRSQAYALLHSKGFPVIKIGKRLTVPREAFLSWIESQLDASTSA